MRLLIVQYGGDYRETFQRLAETGVETYHAQKYVVDAVGTLGKQIEEAILLCCQTKQSYNEVLQDGLRAIGAGLDPYKQKRELVKLIEEQNPTHLVVHTPLPVLFEWAIQKKVRTMALLADSFLTNGLRRGVKNYLLTRQLNNKHIEWVGNHGINSCISLQKIGVNPNKIIPWDWPHVITPKSFLPKELPVNPETWNLVYIGAVQEAKGVGDILQAVAKLRSRNLSVNLQVAGNGEIDYFIQQVKRLNLEDCVKFLGLIPHNNVIELMIKADIVLVPSRHDYPEGFPLTIYEAFCSRTPLVASDHPMFKGNLQNGVNAMIFPAGNSTALAACIEKLLSDRELYRSLSQASDDAWQRLQIPVKWAELIERWLNDSPENQHWLSEHRLTSGIYNSRFT